MHQKTVNNACGNAQRAEKMSGTLMILPADDHKVLREAAAELIDHQPDLRVVGQAGTGEEAIERGMELQPDVVVMDAAMPRSNGLKATRRIVADFPNTRVLVLSAHQDAEHVIPLREAGATGYLSKTVSINELLAANRATSRGESVLPTPIASLVVKHISGELPPVKEHLLTASEALRS